MFRAPPPSDFSPLWQTLIDHAHSVVGNPEGYSPDVVVTAGQIVGRYDTLMSEASPLPSAEYAAVAPAGLDISPPARVISRSGVYKIYAGMLASRLESRGVAANALRRVQESGPRTLTPADHTQTMDQFMTAHLIRAGIRYVNQFGDPRIEQGKILVNREGEYGRFTLLKNDGTQLSLAIPHVLPESIEIFPIKLRPLRDDEAELLSRLDRALEEGQYVSLLAPAEFGSQSFLFEGWITGIEPASDGEYLIRLNVDGPDEEGRFVRLEKIAPESFAFVQPRQSSIATEALAGSRMSSYADAGMEVPLMPDLISAFADFANPNLATGPELPAGLAKLFPGHEMRFYFAEGELSIRLTVRHNADGSWSFGDTAYDHKSVDESFYHPSNGERFGRYSRNEYHDLSSQKVKHDLPARALRVHLRSIRDVLLREILMKQFGAILETWYGAMPEQVHDADVLELVLPSQDLEYDLARGLVAATKPMTKDQRKKLTAIEYLVANKLTFWSILATASGVETGIYPKDSQTVNKLHLGNYDFERCLYNAMEKFGLKYTDGEWEKKRTGVAK